MNKHRFLIYSGTACAAIAAGSIGSWASGYLGSSGLSSFGLLTMLGAGFAAVALWRWAVSQEWLALVVVQAAGSLCIAAAIYAAYHDVYDPYTEAGDTWVNYIGWGLILTLVAACALTGLCLLWYRRNRSTESSLFSWPSVGFLASSIPAIAVTVGVVFAMQSGDSAAEPRFPPPGSAEQRLPPAEAGRSIPDHALKIAGEKVKGTTWGAWLFGNEDQENCLGTRTVRDKFPSKEGAVGNMEEAYCGLGVPPRYWQQVVEGPMGDGRVALIFLIRRDVGRLALLTGRDGRQAWSRVSAQTIPTQQASKARLRHAVGYAVAEVPRPACLRRVVVFNSAGKRLARSRLFPCR